MENRDLTIVACGGNLGDVPKTIDSVLATLSSHESIKIESRSPLYVSSPLPVEGGKPQANYINGVFSLRTTLSPEDLLKLLFEIETSHGRDRSRSTYWGPRYIDLDIIAVGSKCINVPGLEVPHPRYRDRDFVLRPLKDIQASWICPVTAEGIDDLIAALPEESQYIIGTL